MQSAIASSGSRSIPYALPSDALEGLLHLAAHVALTEAAALFLQQGENCWVLATSGVSPGAAHTAALLVADVLEGAATECIWPDASAGPEAVGLMTSALASRPGFLLLQRFAVEGPDCYAILALAHSVARPLVAEETGILLSEVARQIALRMEARAEKRELQASRERRIQRDRFLEWIAREGAIGQCLVDSGGYVISVSDSLVRDLQIQRQDVIGQRFEQMIAFESAFGDDSGTSSTLAAGQDRIPWERVIDTSCFYRQPSGTLLRLAATATVLRLGDNSEAWCVAFCHAEAQPLAALHHSHRHKKVLIAEDHPVNQRVIQGMIEKLGLSADVVSNGLEAVHAACHEHYTAILMDCQMPDMDGIEATRFIRSNEDRIGRVPIVAVTAFGHDEDRRRCFDAGVDEYMVKPIRIEALARVLSQWAHVNIESEEAPQPDAVVPVQDHARQEASEAINRLSADLDPELVREVVVLFLDDTNMRLEEIRKLSAALDRTQLHNAAHKIKGSCGSLGARALMVECERLEVLAQSGSREQIEECVERVAGKYAAIVPILREQLATLD